MSRHSVAMPLLNETDLQNMISPWLPLLRIWAIWNIDNKNDSTLHQNRIYWSSVQTPTVRELNLVIINSGSKYAWTRGETDGLLLQFF